jgi:hypothetical protein
LGIVCTRAVPVEELLGVAVSVNPDAAVDLDTFDAAREARRRPASISTAMSTSSVLDQLKGSPSVERLEVMPSWRSISRTGSLSPAKVPVVITL